MIACSSTTAQPFRCPTKWDLFRQVMVLLPRGRAWQSHDEIVERVGAPQASQVGTFEVGATGLGQEINVERLTVLERYWAAFAEVLEYLHQRACALIDEFFCDTTDEMLPEWHIDYGFPDPCDPWPTLCDKVRALGGQTCAYLTALAADLGYAITCDDRCPAMLSADGLSADCAIASGFVPNQVVIRVITEDSPAMTPQSVFSADSLVADCTPACPPVPDGIICLIERFKPAHVRAIYEVV